MATLLATGVSSSPVCYSRSTGRCPLRAGCPLSGRSPFSLSWTVLVSVTAHPWQRQDTAKGGGWSQERHKETGQGTEPSTTILRSACDLAQYKVTEPEGEGCYSLGGPWGPNPRARPAWHHEHHGACRPQTIPSPSSSLHRTHPLSMGLADHTDDQTQRAQQRGPRETSLSAQPPEAASAPWGLCTEGCISGPASGGPSSLCTSTVASLALGSACHLCLSNPHRGPK